MHIEAPERPLHSFRDIAIQYAMIVLGILTAIGFEQLVLAVHHHELATKAALQIEVELQRNLAETNDAVAANESRLIAVKALMDELMADARAGVNNPDAVRERMKSLTSIRLVLPGLRRNAWDAAIANQALTYLQDDDLRRYSECYTGQTLISQTLLQDVTIGGWLTRLGDTSIDNRLGKADVVSVVKALNGYLVVLSSAVDNLTELQRNYREALAVRAPDHAASAPSSAVGKGA